MPFKFNPFSGNFDQTGSGGGGASYIDGEVAAYNDLPLSSTTAPLNSAWLVRGSSGVWPFTKPGGVYIRTATGGSSRDADYTYAGVFPDVFSDANFTLYDDSDTSKNLKFQLSGISANTTRTFSAPDASGRIQVEGQPIGNTTPAAGSFTNLSASAELQLPTNAPASPSAGDLYRVSNTLRYRDSTNTERLLLNATDNLANLADTATALSNLGLLGAIRNMKIVSPSSDVTATSSTTLTNVSGMSFSVAANTTYLILTNLQVNCGSGGYNCEISFPSILNNGTTASGFGIQLPGNNAVAGLSTTTATTVRVSNRGAAQTTPSFSILLVRTDSTGGTANFQWAQNQLSSPTSTILTSTRALIIPLTT